MLVKENSVGEVIQDVFCASDVSQWRGPGLRQDSILWNQASCGGEKPGEALQDCGTWPHEGNLEG